MLVRFLGFSPTDPEAWSELADLYLSQGMYSQAIFAFEEVLVMAPNAWNVGSPEPRPAISQLSVADISQSRCTQG